MTTITIRLDMIQTLALASLVLFAGYAIRHRVAPLDRYNIPAPVIGGFLFAALALLARVVDAVHFQFDTTLQAPLMIAFFTTIGLGANLRLLRVGGPQVILFWALAGLLAAIQSSVGVGLATLLNVNPLLGLLSGSITMTGGHGTGAAFGKLIEEQFAFKGAFTLAMAAATFGLVSGGLLGGPVATRLIKRWKPHHETPAAREVRTERAHRSAETGLEHEIDVEPRGEAVTAFRLLKVLTIILTAMWLGGLLSGWLGRTVTLPAYIGSMIVAALFCNAAPVVRLRIEQRVVEDLGAVALSLFLAMALMSLQLWELLDLAIPLLLILVVQVVIVAAFAWFVDFRLMGRDYDAAVIAGGHCGFGLGATPNAVANMSAITEKFGPAPRAFLVVPMVGAFFIDFTNALIITTFLNLLR